MNKLEFNKEMEVKLQENNKNPDIKKVILRRIFNSFTLCKKFIKVLQNCNAEDKIKDLSPFLNDIETIFKSEFSIYPDIYNFLNWKGSFFEEINQDDDLNRNLSLDIQVIILELFKKFIQRLFLYHETISCLSNNNTQKEQILNEIIFFSNKLIEEEKRYSLKNLRYLMVINKESGIQLYDQALHPINFDTNLISGFLTAIQCFGMKLSFKDTHINELIYNNIQILVENGNLIRLALILDRKPTKYLLELAKNFISKFENQFEKNLLEWNGNVGVFKPACDIVSEIFSHDK